MKVWLRAFVFLCLSLLFSRVYAFKIVTSTTIIADITKNIVGQGVEVYSITAPGVEVHGYQPTPSDIVNASQADLILFNGLNLELWLQKFTRSIDKSVPVVIVSEGIKAIDVVDGHPNPHSWMSFSNSRQYIENIKNALIKYDPENKDTYIKNSKEYEEKFKDLANFYKSRVESIPEEKRWLVTSEGAFSYLALDLGFKEAFIWPVNSDQIGTPKQIRDLIKIVRKNGIPVVFSESTISDEPAKKVAKESGAKYGGVLYVDSLSTEDGPTPDYISLLKVTTETILSAFGK